MGTILIIILVILLLGGGGGLSILKTPSIKLPFEHRETSPYAYRV